MIKSGDLVIDPCYGQICRVLIASDKEIYLRNINKNYDLITFAFPNLKNFNAMSPLVFEIAKLSYDESIRIQK